MNNRNREIIKMALIYMNANLDDIIECFGNEGKRITVGGVDTKTPTYEEVEATLLEFQDIL